MAEVAYLSGDTQTARQAVQLLIPVVDSHRDDVEAMLALGKAMVQAGQPRMALHAWSSVLQLQPRHESALEAMASTLHQSGELQQAKEAYRQLVTVNPTRSRYFGRLAHVLGQLGEFPAGIAAAETALTMDPSLAQTHAWLAEVYREAGDTEKADEHARKFELFRSAEQEDAN